ncbi:hypothetical protein AOCH_003088 [Aspergillus ochraceoroseus]|uniref:Carrier domain-containing protein n=1 Tax=Aspergillus ochraceoroseus TaxID=138278 RepID=A0A0F8TZX3_9EURO|nr:hypothetical protein AOCH_003088 [Aspergillus ochraceoroseus]
MERAVRVVATRHEALRTCFVPDEADAAQAYQKVLPSSPIRLRCKKINSKSDVDSEYQRLRMQDLDLASGELLRLVLLTLAPSSHYLLVYHHHIIMDGISLQVFLADLEKAYNGESLGPAPRQYPDFSAAQRQAVDNGGMEEELKYWRGVFPAHEQPPILPLLPMARTSSRVQQRIEPTLAARIRAVSKAQRSTPFHLYLAAFKAMLFCFTDADDLTIGVADGARNDPSVMGSIGFFLNLLTLRFRRQPEQSFADAIVEARKTSHAALENSRLPFDVLLTKLNVERRSTHSPFFQAFLDYRQGLQEKQAWGNCQLEMSDEVHTGKTAYDLTVDVTDGDTDAVLMFRAQKSIYDWTATQLLGDTYVHFLDALTSNPSLVMNDIPLFGDEQLAEAVRIGRGPKLVSDWPETLPHRIDQAAQGNQDKVALMDGTGKELTYRAMTSRLEAIAESLHNAGVRAGQRVLVFQQATADWPCSMLAIMRIGAVYVPLDLRNPIPRLAAVAQDCEPAAVLVDATTLDDAPQLGVPSAHILNVAGIGLAASAPIVNQARADSPAAILYTSGSTGVPKGIVVTHAGLRNEIEGYTKMWKLGAERVLQQSAFTFNHSSDQMYTGLVNGGMVYIVPWEKRGNPLEITKIIQQHGITYTKATPSEYSLWMQFGGDDLRRAAAWRFAFGGGESLTPAVTQEFADLELPQLRLFNSYGPTEISISSTKMEIAYRDQGALERMGRIPCGYSLPNYYMYAVDEQLRPVPAGMPGQLCIGGAGVSLGYLKNQALTDKHFVPNPFATAEDIANGWTRMYLTGDIGHLETDGAMVFRSRMAGDTQVKIRGLRIELTDIESNIVAAAGGALRDAVVTLREGNPEFLVAHVVFAPQQSAGIADREAFLQQLLHNLAVPQYMVPVVAIPLDALPLTNHSKVNRKVVQGLPLPQRARSSDPDEDAEMMMTETMARLRALWREVLGKNIDQLGLDITPSTSFFLVGGNSLLIIRLQARIRSEFDVAVSLVDLLGANTLRQMARRIEEAATVKVLDWDHETTPPVVPSFLQAVCSPTGPDQARTPGKTILLTGATGFLSRFLLPQLIARPDVDTIHCVAVRDADKLSSSPKIVPHTGDLSLPLLGLSEDMFRDLARTVDVILHMGAARSFWDSYHVLRATNVLATKTLVMLAAPRRVPIHYLSTGAAEHDHPPAADGSNGYTATRWASERILERSSTTRGVPSYVYRFLPAAAQRSAPPAVLEEFLRCADLTAALPDLRGWQGRLDLLPAEPLAHELSRVLLDTPAHAHRTQVRHFESPATVSGAELATYLAEHRGSRADLPRVPLLQWIGRVKKSGFVYFLASHEATLDKPTDGQGSVKLQMHR